MGLKVDLREIVCMCVCGGGVRISGVETAGSASIEILNVDNN
jgi:hypothetical protein